jgi:hypothetical protein
MGHLQWKIHPKLRFPFEVDATATVDAKTILHMRTAEMQYP